jgi:hypothetical protein
MDEETSSEKPEQSISMAEPNELTESSLTKPAESTAPTKPTELTPQTKKTEPIKPTKANPIKRTLKTILLIIFFLILSLFLTRLLNPREIDDVSPGIPCEKEYLQKSDVLWAIPDFDNIPISENSTWCSYILGLNKTIEMHGVTHEYDEFGTDRTDEYLQNGTKIFRDCFGFAPTSFKPPQLIISKNNKELIKNNNLKLKFVFNQVIHKVYHCNNTDFIKNKVIDWF